jgi:5-methylcytosine-specific restriction endonuclease McrA
MNGREWFNPVNTAILNPPAKSNGLSPVLQRPTLVLNRNWQPINVATVARALLMLWNDTARIVDPVDYQLFDWDDWSRLVPDRDEPFIQSFRQKFRVPEVITLTKFDRLPTQTVAFSRRNVFKRDKMTCQYCGKTPGSEELTIDHVVPRARGGQSTWTNCVLACVECNSKKAARTPDEANMRLRNKPIRPKWKPSYAQRTDRIESWSKFISEAYWNVELEA